MAAPTGVFILTIWGILWLSVRTRSPVDSREAERTCSPLQFACNDSTTCVSLGWRCDDEKDCPDGSDESPNICIKKNETKCPVNHIHCLGSEKCLHMSKLCDANWDCSDGFDEGPHCRAMVANCTPTMCRHKCAITRDGPACYCANGYEVTEDGRGCKDFDECNIYGSCSQQCQNTGGSYTCGCVEGYLLQLDGRSCKAKNEPVDRPAVLVIVNYGSLVLQYLNTSFVPGLSRIPVNQVTGLDFLYSRERVCWLDSAGEERKGDRLHCVMLPGLRDVVSLPPVNLSLSLHTVEQLAIDWLTGNFYFVDSVDDRIFVCGETGSTCVTLLDHELFNPKAIALDPTMGKLFFTDYGQIPKVERCDMDGGNRTRLVDSKIVFPSGLALDLVSKLVYWADAYLDYIEMVDYEGRGRRTIIQGSSVENLYWLSVFENYIYATNLENRNVEQNGTVIRIHRFNSSDYQVLSRVLHGGALHIYHSRRQPTVRSHACEQDQLGRPGGCSDLCLLASSHKTRTCRCRHGFSLGSDGKSCKKPEHDLFLLYCKGRPGMVRGMDITGRTPHDYMIPIENLVNPRAIDFHAATETIYFADTTSLLLGRQKIDGSERETILKTNINQVEGIAVDWLGNNLYWTDDGLKSVSVARLEKASQAYKTLVEGGMTHPRAIVVDPPNGLMYWTDWEENHKDSKTGKIERAWMDGSNRKIFVSSKTMLWPNSLSLDTDNARMYWCDAYFDRIESVNLDGTDRKVVYDGPELNHPFGLTHHGNFLFWSEYRRGTIYRLDQTTRNATVLRIERPPVFHMRVYNKDVQKGANACQLNNGGCSSLCLAIPGGRVCACSNDQVLLNNVTCIQNPDYTLPPKCPAGQFACKNGRCIQNRWRCDGDNDCLDSSDESPEICRTQDFRTNSLTGQKMRNATLLQGHGERYITWRIHRQLQAITLPPRKGKNRGISSNTGLTPQLAQFRGKIE